MYGEICNSVTFSILIKRRNSLASMDFESMMSKSNLPKILTLSKSIVLFLRAKFCGVQFPQLAIEGIAPQSSPNSHGKGKDMRKTTPILVAFIVSTLLAMPAFAESQSPTPPSEGGGARVDTSATSIIKKCSTCPMTGVQYCRKVRVNG